MNTCEYLLRMIVPWSNLRQNWETQHYTIQGQGVPLCTIQIDCNVCFKCLKVIQRNKDFEIRIKNCWALSEDSIFYIPLHVFAIISMQHEVGGTAGCISVCSISRVLQWGALLVPQLGRRRDCAGHQLMCSSRQPVRGPAVNLSTFTVLVRLQCEWSWAARREYGSPFLKPTR